MSEDSKKENRQANDSLSESTLDQSAKQQDRHLTSTLDSTKKDSSDSEEIDDGGWLCL